MVRSNIPKILAYQYSLEAARNEEDELSWKTDSKLIDKLFLGFPWKSILSDYNKRANFYYGFSVSGHGDDLFAVIDAKVETSKASLTAPEFLLEVAVMPHKCSMEHHKLLLEVLDTTLEDATFKVWWEHDRRGPRKRKVKDKKKIIDEIKKLGNYAGEDDLKLEDVEVSISEALTYFGFAPHLDRKEVRNEFKAKYRKLQLKHHPDSETGNEENFLYLQKCRGVLGKWIKW
jgi:hypothetical protein